MLPYLAVGSEDALAEQRTKDALSVWREVEVFELGG